MSHYDKELKMAIEVIRKAILITEWFRKKGIKSLSFKKSDLSPVTIADLASQIYIISQIKEYFKDDQIIAEEENSEFIDNDAEILIRQCFEELGIPELTTLKDNIGYRGKASNRKWTIDPIDGTIGYQKGLTYAIGVGLLDESNPQICAIGVPNYHKSSLSIFIAEEGHGTYVSSNNSEFKRIHVNKNENIHKIQLCHSLHYDKPWVLNFANKIGINNFIQIDSMAKFAIVADGTADLYIKPLDKEHSFTWDFMPGDLIVKEAGGNVTDLNGKPLKFNEEKCLWTAPGIIATNGIIHDKIVDLIQNEYSF